MLFRSAQVEINSDILNDPRYDYLFSVEEVNRLTLSGVPFRDAYKQIGLEIEAGKFKPTKTVHHTHQGSIGNLCNNEICAYKDEVVSQFSFEKVREAEKELLR